MATGKPLYGQINQDKSLEYYGTLDTLVKLCVDNNIDDISVVGSEFNYDENSTSRNSNFTGYPYTNGYDTNVNICPIPTGFQIVEVTEDKIIVRFNNPQSLGFQYYYNISGDEPTENQWINTTSSIIIITDLDTEENVYHIFLRTKCNTKLFSPSIKIDSETP